MSNKEIKYLKNLINEFKIDEDLFKIYYGDSTKFIMGTFTPLGQKQNLMAKIINFKTLKDTINDLDYKIKISLFEAIKHSYSKELQTKFNFFSTPSDAEILSYYYIENAVFRIQSLWDLLAQLYCLRYDVPKEPNNIYYNKIFSVKNPLNERFKEKAEEIEKYIKEDEEKEGEWQGEGAWKGNHKFVNQYRNQMTHRNSPNVPSMSDFSFNIKTYPTYILKRLIEDYNQVGKYLLEILEESSSYIMALGEKESLI